MKAVVKAGPVYGAVLKEVPVPEPGRGEVLVQIKAASICGTDHHIYIWNEWSQNRIKPPRVMGHEFAGEVVEVGPEVTTTKPGDYVSAETHIVCDGCVQCMLGEKHVCQNTKILGVDTDGCFAARLKHLAQRPGDSAGYRVYPGTAGKRGSHGHVGGDPRQDLRGIWLRAYRAYVCRRG